MYKTPEQFDSDVATLEMDTRKEQLLEKKYRRALEDAHIKENTSPVVACYIANYIDAHPGKKITRLLRWRLSREAWRQWHKQKNK